MSSIKRVAILAMNPWTGSEKKLEPFSYAAYRIAASVVAHPDIPADVKVFDEKGWTLENWVEGLMTYGPDVIGCSTYVWSLPTFHALLAEIRVRAPHVKTVLGGPSARPEMLALPPFRQAVHTVDALVIGEGEEAFTDLLLCWMRGGNAREVAGLAVPEGDVFVRTAKRPNIDDLTRLASPFQMGIAPMSVSAHLETFRGCPMSCMFCQWGVADSRLTMTAEAIKQELLAFRAGGAKSVYLVDAGINLNQRAFRALRDAEAEVGFCKETRIQCEVYPANMTEEHTDFLKSVPSYVGMGLQSMDQSVLDGMQRPFQRRKFDAAVERLAEVTQQLSISLIVGLPGDSPEQFKQTLAIARQYPVDVGVHHCLVLPDALLTRAPASYNLRFDPVTLEMKSCLGWSEKDLLDMFEYLTLEVEKSGGTWTRYFPRPVQEGDTENYIGKPIGASMWMFRHRPFGDSIPVQKGQRMAIFDDGWNTISADSKLSRICRTVVETVSRRRWSLHEVSSNSKYVRYTLNAGERLLHLDVALAAGAIGHDVVHGGMACWFRNAQLSDNAIFTALAPVLAEATRKVGILNGVDQPALSEPA